MTTKPHTLTSPLQPADLPNRQPPAGDAHMEEEATIAQLPWMIGLTCSCLVATGLGWLLGQYTDVPAWLVWALYLLAYLSGSYYSLQEAWASLRQRQFDVNFLMIMAAAGAALVGQPHEGAMLMFLFALSNTLETYAMGRTHAAIRALLDLTPKRAAVYRDGVARWVPIEQVQLGDLVQVQPGAQIPTDGVVIQGESAVNEASITGESIPIDKRPGARVFAGTLNGQGALDVRVSATAGDSTLARIVAIVREARAQKAASQDFTERVIGQGYARAVVGLTLLAILIPPLLLGWDLGTTIYRAMTLMVVASPCALVISIPATLLAALARAAREGVLFKGGRHLETAARVRVVAFDKTGTLTTGQPSVVAVIPIGVPACDSAVTEQAPVRQGQTADDRLGVLTAQQARLLAAAAAIEQYSEHPLARAIVGSAQSSGLRLPSAEGFVALTGIGAQARIAGQALRIGRPALFGPLAPTQAQLVADYEQRGHSVVLLGQEHPWGLIALADTCRPTAAAVIARLRASGIEQVVLLTGDNAGAAHAIGAALGVDQVRAGLLPHEKVAAVQELQARHGPVAMVGDGVNDAPALATAALGIAMGAAGSDVALESADVLLMSDDLAQLPGAFGLARQARRVVRQNLAFAFAVMASLMLLALLGDLPLPLGVLGHEGSTLLVVANGLRLLAGGLRLEA